MNKHNLIVLLILSRCFIVIDGVFNPNFYGISLRERMHHCPMVQNDLDVVKSKDFAIPLNPFEKNLPSYGKTDQSGHIIYLKITNKTSIPPEIFGLKYLKQLEIYNTCFYPCKQPVIPSHIQCLASSLTELTIYDTNIKFLPEQIGALKHLQTFILSNTGLRFLSPVVGSLSELKMLSLPGNYLKSIPKAMIKLRNLITLDLSNNLQLSSVQQINGLENLTHLDVRQCSIEQIPKNLSSLTLLYMTNNKLTSLSGIETLGYGTTVGKYFFFNKNSINFVPPQVDQVPTLIKLNLDDNKINYLLSNFCDMPKLKLSMKNNPYNDTNMKEDCFIYQNRDYLLFHPY